MTMFNSRSQAVLSGKTGVQSRKLLKGGYGGRMVKEGFTGEVFSDLGLDGEQDFDGWGGRDRM